MAKNSQSSGTRRTKLNALCPAQPGGGHLCKTHNIHLFINGFSSFAGLRHSIEVMGDGSEYKLQDRMPHAVWAWEFLRRNADYRREYCGVSNALPTPFALSSGASFLKLDRSVPDARKWGLVTFADPEKMAIDANVFWCPELLASAVRICLTEVESSNSDTSKQDDRIILSALKTRRIILDTADGIRHIVLNGHRFWIQLFCCSDLPRSEHTAISIRIDNAKYMRRRLDTAAQLLSLYRSHDGKLSLIGRRQNSNALVNALTAFDIQNGFERPRGDLKDIAEAIVGKARVEADWGVNDRALKAQIKRALARADRLIGGDYRSFLSRKNL